MKDRTKRVEDLAGRAPHVTPGAPLQVDLFIPCYVDQFLPSIGLATLRLLRELGCEVRYPAGQTCCGQPAWNAGCKEQANQLAQRLSRVFDGEAPIVVPSGSCAAMVHETTSLGDRVVELSRFLDQQGARIQARFPHRVGIHDGCHALSELGIGPEPRRLLTAVGGIELVELPNAAECCGFGGGFSVDFPAVSAGIADAKLTAEVDYLVTTEPSCLLHLAGRRARLGKGPRLLHISEVLTADD